MAALHQEPDRLNEQLLMATDTQSTDATANNAKRGPGQPKKMDSLLKASTKPSEDPDNFRRLLAEAEARLSSQISETISCAIAPIKSLVASLQTVLNNRVESLETKLRQFLGNID